jgi:hypothetical protein
MQYSKMGSLCRIYPKVGIHNVLSYCIAAGKAKILIQSLEFIVRI